MDESAKSGVRTRKRNKSIKDSAKLVSHRIYLKKKCEFVAYIKLISPIFKISREIDERHKYSMTVSQDFQ